MDMIYPVVCVWVAFYYQRMRLRSNLFTAISLLLLI